ISCLGLSGLSLACNDSNPGLAQESQKSVREESQSVLQDRPTGEAKPKSGYKRSPLGKGVWLETKGDRRRVVIEATVCLREGEYGLECLLCRTGTKEHESVLHTSADARLIHAGLLATGAKPGSPVRYKEVGKEIITVPPTGEQVKVTLEYEKDG